MIIIVKMRRRGFVMLVLFCLNCRRRKVPPLPCIGIEWEREIDTPISENNSSKRWSDSEREGKKEQLRKKKKNQLVILLNIQPIHRKYPIGFYYIFLFFLIRSCCLLLKVSCYSSSVTISFFFSHASESSKALLLYA